MRLARFGYRTAVIPSTTYEEAPAASRSVAQAAHALVQGLDANLAGAYALAARLARELGLGRLCGVPACGRRHGAGRAGPCAVRRQALLGACDRVAGRRSGPVTARSAFMPRRC